MGAISLRLQKAPSSTETRRVPKNKVTNRGQLKHVTSHVFAHPR